MNDLVRNLSQVSGKVKKSVPDLWNDYSLLITGIIGVLAYAASLVGMYLENKLPTNVLAWVIFIGKEVGQLLLLGTFFGLVVKTAFFREMMIEITNDIFFGHKFLREQKNIREIWERVCRVLCDLKFPAISSSLENLIFDKYLPTNSDHYREGYKWAAWCKKFDGEYMHMDIHVEYTVKDMAAPYVYEYNSTWEVDILSDDNERSNVQMNSLKINGENIKIDPECSTAGQENINGSRRYIYKKTLEGEPSYRIEECASVVFSVRANPYWWFKATVIINGMSVEIKGCEGLKVLFVPAGTIENFEDTNSVFGHIKKKYNDLILPEQGFVLVFSLDKEAC